MFSYFDAFCLNRKPQLDMKVYMNTYEIFCKRNKHFAVYRGKRVNCMACNVVLNTHILLKFRDLPPQKKTLPRHRALL